MHDNQIMTNAGQILIIAAISILTLVTTVIGIQIMLILRDVRHVSSRAHAVLNSFEKLGTNIATGSTEVVGFISGLKSVLQVVEIINEKSRKHESKK